MTKEYLGDSVYVEIEDGMFKLTTENGFDASNTIFLEPQVYDAFVSYAKRAFEFYKAQQAMRLGAVFGHGPHRPCRMVGRVVRPDGARVRA